MVLWGKELVSKVDNLSSIPRNHLVKDRTECHILIALWSPYICYGTCMLTQRNTHMYLYIK